ncbi:MAG: 50S ribosomal protein L1 [Chloroflexi bacterium]|nr:50S ribosomal protein L1 [Chloroflexota bacterium]
MAKHGKRYRGSAELVDKTKSYGLTEAVALVKQAASTKFDETVEMHLRTGADTRHADQSIRGVVILPHGLGKTVKVLVFAQGDAARAAQEAGADYVGDDDLIKRIEGGWVEFDTALATQEMMSKVGRLGRVLGRRGLMPNPRTGTVVQPQNIARAVDEARQGRVEVRMDRTAIIHTPVGKVSFDEQALVENVASVVAMVVRARPASIKGQFIRSAYLCSTMGPSIEMDVSSLMAVRAE